MSCHHKIYHLAVIFVMTAIMVYAGPSFARDLLDANTPKVPNIEAGKILVPVLVNDEVLQAGCPLSRSPPHLEATGQ